MIVLKKNNKLHIAKKYKNDEFYTEFNDIANEILPHEEYWEHFKGKTIYMNCDNPQTSQFFWFFVMNFHKFKLKKVISTFYNPNNGPADKFEWAGELEDGLPTNIIRNRLKGNGDFRSDECIEILKESDIVITNPPFSLFREYVGQLIKYDKQFLILGNMNAITYKEIFPLLKENKLFTGYGFNLSLIFKTEYPNLLESNRKYVIAKGYNPDEGYVKVPAITWFTNLKLNKHNEPLELTKLYEGNENNYPKYDNYNAINCDKVADIPKDYYGVIGVPITFLNAFSPQQFNIIGLSSKSNAGTVERSHDDAYYNGYARGRITTRMDSNLPLLDVATSGGTLCKKENSKNLYQLYWRIFIQRKID